MFYIYSFLYYLYLYLLRQSTENKIQMNLQTIANNNKQSQANAESIKKYFFTDSIRTNN